jgi:hypothetical protein
MFSFQLWFLVYELPNDGTDVQKHVGVVKDDVVMFVISVFVWFNKLIC